MTAGLGLSYARFRDGVVRGEVHDGNAFRRGGVAGNAGLFGTARDVWRLARTWLDPGQGAGSRRTGLRISPEARGLGMAGQAAGPARRSPAMLGPRVRAHRLHRDLPVDGPGPRRHLVLLTNRIHPGGGRRPTFNEVRRRFHERASEIAGVESYRTSASTAAAGPRMDRFATRNGWTRSSSRRGSDSDGGVQRRLSPRFPRSTSAREPRREALARSGHGARRGRPRHLRQRPADLGRRDLRRPARRA